MSSITSAGVVNYDRKFVGTIGAYLTIVIYYCKTYTVKATGELITPASSYERRRIYERKMFTVFASIRQKATQA